jgi:predicted nuclease with TOPRIM domain
MKTRKEQIKDRMKLLSDEISELEEDLRLAEYEWQDLDNELFEINEEEKGRNK